MSTDFDQLNAHTPRKGTDEWHKLKPHLLSVAAMAARFARAFGADDLAFVAGLWHDLGKVNPQFQDYLDACDAGKFARSVPHAASGAAYSYRAMKDHVSGDDWVEVSLAILGHHAGLAEIGNATTTLHTWNNCELLSEMIELANTLPPAKRPSPPPPDTRRELRLRMIFSALVDADYRDTENHFEPQKTHARGEWTRPADLWPIFRADQLRMMWNGRGSSAVNRVRRVIYHDCVRSAEFPPGVFRLTVPTGGGKTRSALAFALRHAVTHPQTGFRRIIVALPYTSIIDQTAREYRAIFGDRLVLEHHSQLEMPSREDQDELRLWHRLASENWDHPLIVTTTVQLFESLFHNRPSRCRKLHNIAGSILILDEVQTLPPELLAPTLDVLRDLVDNYQVTLVLCTATQPAFDQTPYLKAFDGIEIKEIVPEPERFFLDDQMRRVEYEPVRWEQDLDELADELSSPNSSQVMAVFNTRKAALDMLERLLHRKADGVFHLSTSLCGAHRKRVLSEIKRRLNAYEPQPVRLVSTQVVEAGVDLDFPLVYRALGPLDRIVQAAGRCNREGRRPGNGRVVIFDFDANRAPPGSYRIGLDDALTLLKRNSPDRLHHPQIHTEYFQSLFRDVNLDKEGIQPYRRSMNFPEVASRYKLIKDTVLVIVPEYDPRKVESRIRAHLKNPSRDTFRRLMPYTVNMRHDELKRADIRRHVEEMREGLYRWTGPYDKKTHRGLVGVMYDPADLIVSD